MSGMRRAAGAVTEGSVTEELPDTSLGTPRDQAGLALDEVEDLYSQHHRCMVFWLDQNTAALALIVGIICHSLVVRQSSGIATIVRAIALGTMSLPPLLLANYRRELYLRFREPIIVIMTAASLVSYAVRIHVSVTMIENGGSWALFVANMVGLGPYLIVLFCPLGYHLRHEVFFPTLFALVSGLILLLDRVNRLLLETPEARPHLERMAVLACPSGHAATWLQETFPEITCGWSTVLPWVWAVTSGLAVVITVIVIVHVEKRRKIYFLNSVALSDPHRLFLSTSGHIFVPKTVAALVMSLAIAVVPLDKGLLI